MALMILQKEQYISEDVKKSVPAKGAHEEGTLESLVDSIEDVEQATAVTIVKNVLDFIGHSNHSPSSIAAALLPQIDFDWRSPGEEVHGLVEYLKSLP